MRYYKFSAAERKLVMAEAELPEPGPGQVRVRVSVFVNGPAERCRICSSP